MADTHDDLVVRRVDRLVAMEARRAYLGDDLAVECAGGCGRIILPIDGFSGRDENDRRVYFCHECNLKEEGTDAV